jgi:cytochrome bd ubiquinol oxidase subunit I
LLPTFLGAFALPALEVMRSLGGFVLFYSALAVVDVYRLVCMIRRGPH